MYIGQEMNIGVLDSGVGGITVLSSLLKLMPHENYIYLADKKGMPYGDKPSEYILARTAENCRKLIGLGVKAIVIACNTATNVGISALRQTEADLNSCIYVGLEPAVMPAVRFSPGGRILVLLTPATAIQQKFLQLLEKCGSDNIIVSPQKELAQLIENNINNLSVLKNKVYGILSEYQNIDAVVLGCTHYVLIKDIISEFYGYKVEIFDGGEGAARRLLLLLRQKNLLNTSDFNGAIKFICT